MEEWNLDGIRCLSAQKNQTQAFWAFEAYKLISATQTQALNIEIGQRHKGTLRLARERLKRMHEHLELQAQSFAKLLQPLNWQSVQQNAYVSYLSNSPGSSFLSENIGYLYRDWNWGERENKAAVDLLRASLAADSLDEELLVLGAGACRLAYDLHREFKPRLTRVVDYNPMMLLAAKRIIAGETLKLVELPIVPTRAEDFSVPRELRAPEAVSKGIEYLVADLRDFSIPIPTAKTILTPWLVDVVRVDFSSFVQRLNSLLPMGGRWLNFGPLGFNNSQLSDYYSYEEVVHLIQKNGFKIERSSYEVIPYLQSPASNSHRLERVFCFSAIKTEDVEVVITKQPGLLPWEIDADEKIEIPIEHMRLKLGHEFNAQLCALLKDQPTFNELVQALHTQYKIPLEHTAYMVTQLLRNIHFQSLSNPLDHK